MKNFIKIENNIVKKTFTNECDFLTEYHFYLEHKEFHFIPKLLGVEKSTIHLEHIKGQNMYAIGTQQQLLLAKTLAEFHSFNHFNKSLTLDTNASSYLNLLHYDTNLKNYIYCGTKIYMIDFTDITIGNPMYDVYSVMLFFCETHHSDVFNDFLNSFLEVYMNTSKICCVHSLDILYHEIERLEKRREEKGKSIYNYKHYIKNKDTFKKKIESLL